jgi:hypothetical protein
MFDFKDGGHATKLFLDPKTGEVLKAPPTAAN